MLTDVVYILGDQSRWGNEEIRYSLRSVEKHLTGYRLIHIIGEPVDFLEVHQISCPDQGKIKEINILKKILFACEQKSISDPFIFFNDDHYLNRNFDAANFPYFYEDTIMQTMYKRKVEDAYMAAMKNSYRALSERGLPNLYYDVHTPMLIHKKEFIGIMGSYNWEGFGNIVKSLYLNTLGVKPEEFTDCKISPAWSEYQMLENVKNAPVFSSPGSHSVKKKILQLLYEKYPKPSKWEISHSKSSRVWQDLPGLSRSLPAD